jgi:hypothetical protein
VNQNKNPDFVFRTMTAPQRELYMLMMHRARRRFLRKGFAWGMLLGLGIGLLVAWV